MTLAEQVESVRSREDLASFVDALRADLLNNTEGWENADLGSFLEALAAWVRDLDGYYQNQGRAVPKEPDWGVVADMLMAAKMYE